MPTANQQSNRLRAASTLPAANAFAAACVTASTHPNLLLMATLMKSDTKPSSCNLEGINLRRIGRILSVNHQSVTNWVNAYHARLPEASTPVERPQTLEMDELFTFIGSKKHKPIS